MTWDCDGVTSVTQERAGAAAVLPSLTGPVISSPLRKATKNVVFQSISQHNAAFLTLSMTTSGHVPAISLCDVYCFLLQYLLWLSAISFWLRGIDHRTTHQFCVLFQLAKIFLLEILSSVPKKPFCTSSILQRVALSRFASTQHYFLKNTRVSIIFWPATGNS